MAVLCLATLLFVSPYLRFDPAYYFEEQRAVYLRHQVLPGQQQRLGVRTGLGATGQRVRVGQAVGDVDRLHAGVEVLDGQLGGDGVAVLTQGPGHRGAVDGGVALPGHGEVRAGPGLDARGAVVVPGARLGDAHVEDVVAGGDALARAVETAIRAPLR